MAARVALHTLLPAPAGGTRPRGRARVAELHAWAMPVAPELLELATLHDAGAVPEQLHEFWPFAHVEAFFPDEGGFDGYLAQAQAFGWPVFYLAHFAGLHPIGATRGGDYWLARLTPDASGTSRVYKYDHETGELTLAFRSIAELIRAGLARASVYALPPVPAPRLAAADDPLVLWTRASWAADVIGATALEPWSTTLAAAPTRATFARERARLAARPDLLAYWLIAHALLGNRGDLDAVDQLAATSRNPFVVALRPRARGLLGPSPLEAYGLGTLAAAAAVHRLGDLRARAPRSLRAGTPPPLPAVPPSVALADVEAAVERGELLALMADHGSKVSLHVWALEHLARWADVDHGPREVLERIAEHALTPARLQAQTAWLTTTPPVEDSGQREARLLALLVERGSPRAGEFALRSLAALEQSWWRISLATAAARVAAELEPAAAAPVLGRMVANPTWHRYATALPQLRAALAAAQAAR